MDFATEEAIKVEMRDWSAHALEIPNEYYNNMPACPYAKKAWATDKVGFSFKYDQDWQTLYTLISTWDDSKDVVILIDFCPFLLMKWTNILIKLITPYPKVFSSTKICF